MRPPIILRRPEVEQLTGLKRSALYDLMSRGLFPRPIKLTSTASGWLEREIVAWIEERVRERDAEAG